MKCFRHQTADSVQQISRCAGKEPTPQRLMKRRQQRQNQGLDGMETADWLQQHNLTRKLTNHHVRVKLTSNTREDLNSTLIFDKCGPGRPEADTVTNISIK